MNTDETQKDENATCENYQKQTDTFSRAIMQILLLVILGFLLTVRLYAAAEKIYLICVVTFTLFCVFCIFVCRNYRLLLDKELYTFFLFKKK
jgi:hypothetical protein